MKKPVILAVVEPVSYSLDRSVAWTLASTLKAKQQIALVDSANGSAGALIGIVPILQPIRIVISGQPAFFLAMRAFLDVTSGFQDAYGTTYTLTSSDNSVLAQMSSGTLVSGYANPFLLISSQLPGLAKADVIELSEYLSFLVTTLWQKEPINWTTQRLHLASNGQFMTSTEMNLSGFRTCIPVFAGGGLELTVGAKPVVVEYRQWRGAGAVSATAPEAESDSCSTCSIFSTCDSGGTGDGGTTTSSGGGGS